MKYDAKKQAQAAIETLEAKLHNIRERVASNHLDPVSLRPHTKRERLQYFYYNCERTRVYIRDGISLPRYKHSDSIPNLAHQYVKIECLIERLRKGEDPRTILFEIVSND